MNSRLTPAFGSQSSPRTGLSSDGIAMTGMVSTCTRRRPWRRCSRPRRAPCSRADPRSPGNAAARWPRARRVRLVRRSPQGGAASCAVVAGRPVLCGEQEPFRSLSFRHATALGFGADSKERFPRPVVRFYLRPVGRRPGAPSCGPAAAAVPGTGPRVRYRQMNGTPRRARGTGPRRR